VDSRAEVLPERMLVVDFDGKVLEGKGKPPSETAIHTEILKARPDVEVVLHVHPASIVALDLAGLELAPVVGSYNIPASRMAREGVPVYPRSILVNTPDLGRELADCLGEKSSCVLRGHGLVTTGGTVQEALSRALSLDTLARLMLLAASAGEIPATLPSEDLAQLPDLGPGFNDANIWRCQVASLAAAGYALH